MLLLSVTDANPRGRRCDGPSWLAWVLSVAALGVLMAIPMKRTMINRERLKFPSGTAAAVSCRALQPGRRGAEEGRALLAAGRRGARAAPQGPERGPTVDRQATPRGRPSCPGVEDLRLAAEPAGQPLIGHPRMRRESYPLSAWNMMLDHSLVLVAAGAIIGLRVTLSMAREASSSSSCSARWPSARSGRTRRQARRRPLASRDGVARDRRLVRRPLWSRTAS